MTSLSLRQPISLSIAAVCSALAACDTGHKDNAATSPTIQTEQDLGLNFDTGEAEAALNILDKQAAGAPVTDADWSALFRSNGYLRLREREAAMDRAFEDDLFIAYLTAPEQIERAEELRATLNNWSATSMTDAAKAALAYLPEGADVSATVLILIKPQTNSFVFGIPDNPAIFLYLDPAESSGSIRNTIIHEVHHIGFGNACPSENVPVAKTATEAEERLLMWLGAFGEGFAMLAAAGGPDVHPHAESKPEDRARWDTDMARIGSLLEEQNRFFAQVLGGEITEIDMIDQTARSYYGVQGPWYTVGWLMASTIEQEFGRQRLIEAMCDRTLLATYNNAAKAADIDLPLWDDEIITQLNTLYASSAP